MSAFNNPKDNSDNLVKQNARTIAGSMFESTEEMKDLKDYLEVLKLQTELSKTGAKTAIRVKQKDGTYKWDDVDTKDLLPPESEFQILRKNIILSINAMKEEERRIWLARFDCQDLFSLSSKVANFILDQSRRNAALKTFSGGRMADFYAGMLPKF